MNKSGVRNVGHACCVLGCANRRNANPELHFMHFQIVHGKLKGKRNGSFLFDVKSN